MVDNGILYEGRGNELIDGIILEKVSIKEPHIGLTMRWLFALAKIFGEGYVRCQMPIVLDDFTEPEPDLSVSRKSGEEDLATRETTSAADVRLIVEISVSSFGYDSLTKATLYSKSAIPDYWVLDVEGRRLIVHREPAADGYTSVVAYGVNEIIAPLAAPDSGLRVGDFLP